MPRSTKRRMRKCHDGKRAYATMKEAQAAAHGMLHRLAKRGDPMVTFMRAYGCACGKWHIGKTRDINWQLVKELSANPPQRKLK